MGQKSQKNVEKVESALNNEQRLQEIYREEDIKSEICEKIADIEKSHIESDFADIEKAFVK